MSCISLWPFGNINQLIRDGESQGGHSCICHGLFRYRPTLIPNIQNFRPIQGRGVLVTLFPKYFDV